MPSPIRFNSPGVSRALLVVGPTAGVLVGIAVANRHAHCSAVLANSVVLPIERLGGKIASAGSGIATAHSFRWPEAADLPWLMHFDSRDTALGEAVRG